MKKLSKIRQMSFRAFQEKIVLLVYLQTLDIELDERTLYKRSARHCHHLFMMRTSMFLQGRKRLTERINTCKSPDCKVSLISVLEPYSDGQGSLQYEQPIFLFSH